MAKPSTTRRFARDRVLAAALELFAEHGVSGTSLQMIADRIGVRKGAVYYQFQSKDDIALAVVQPVFDAIEHVTRIAEVLSTSAARQDVAVSGLIEVALQHRPISALFYSDRTIQKLVETHEEFQHTRDRFAALLLGPEPDTAGRVAISMITAGIYASATDPQFADVEEAELRRFLLACSKRCIGT
ncbi:TetR/AcrR family transcriptional regulator [Mycobacterium sp. TNTM28]|uniref:TetR/AcrR family transcriptional regulator n=1 Tax=[Mycobacterium] fortunisiensis TaxID=2600579 RepID=A0ABS6KSU2_9MYCO|nr:TetR/AcrR family transcriptional regulator [[Mycobacterium] fortunisiensis]MBU9766713.1 TetR/AcrR family transcriptional regulator [[Mycobacterium] fortunisiensis]